MPTPVEDTTTQSDDSDTEEQGDGEEEGGEEKEDFPNEEEDYEGPELLQTAPVTTPSDATGGLAASVRFLLVQEEVTQHRLCRVDAMPVSSAELLKLFE